MKAMILAAGRGTRLQPLTEHVPKALVRFQDLTLLEIILRKLIHTGFTSVVINVHHHRDQIIDYVKSNDFFGIDIQFSIEEELLDTGGGIKAAVHLLGDDPVLFHNIDILSDIDLAGMYAFHREHGHEVTLAVKDRPTSRSLLFTHQGCLGGWEYPDRNMRIVSRNSRDGYTYKAFSGIYVLNPSLFAHFPDTKVFSLTPWLLDLSGKVEMQAYDHSEGLWYDLGSTANLEKAAKKVNIRQDGNPAEILKQ